MCARLLRAVLPSALMLLACASAGQAQDCAGGGRFVVRLRPGLINFPAPTAADFDAGWLQAPPSEVLVVPRSSPNRGWELCLRADSPTLGVYGKPVSDIEFRQDGTGTWTPLSTADQLLASGTKGRTVQLEFRVALDWAIDRPGRYETDFTATAAQD